MPTVVCGGVVLGIAWGEGPGMRVHYSGNLRYGEETNTPQGEWGSAILYDWQQWQKQHMSFQGSDFQAGSQDGCGLKPHQVHILGY